MRDVMIEAVAAGSTLTLVSQLHEHYNIDNEEYMGEGEWSGIRSIENSVHSLYKIRRLA
jgi:hypothetical protein